MKTLTRIFLFCAVLTAYLCAAAYASDMDNYALVEGIWIENSNASGTLFQFLADGVPSDVIIEPASIAAPRARLRLAATGAIRTVSLDESKAYRTDGATPAEDTINENFHVGKIIRFSSVSGEYKLYAVNSASQIPYDAASVSRYVMNNGANVKCAVLNNALYGFQMNGEIMTADANTTFIVEDSDSGSIKTYVGIDHTPDIYGLSPYDEPVGYAYCEENVAKIVYFTRCDMKRPDVKIRIPHAPLVNGRPILEAHLDGLEEIAVPVQALFDTPTETLFFASFYGGGRKFVGMGMTAATIDNQTSFVIMPVQSAVIGAKSLKILVTDGDFRPLSEGKNFPLTGGGGGIGGGGGSWSSLTYYLRATVDAAFEDGGNGMAYLTETEPTEDMDLLQASPYSAVFQHKSSTGYYNFTYYIIFTPDDASELDYPRIVQGRNATSVARVNVTLKSAPSAVIYGIEATSGATSEDNAPLVTMKGVIRGDGNGGGGGWLSGGGSPSLLKSGAKPSGGAA